MSDTRPIVVTDDDTFDGPEVSEAEFEALCNMGDACYADNLPWVYTDAEWVAMNERAPRAHDRRAA